MSISATAIVQVIALIALVWYCPTYVWPGVKQALADRKAVVVNKDDVR